MIAYLKYMCSLFFNDENMNLSWMHRYEDQTGYPRDPYLLL